MNSSLLIAPHARHEIVEDNIFKVSAAASAACQKHGHDAVFNASIGVLLDDEGNLCLLPAVEDATARLKTEQIARYAPIAGLPEYREDVIEYLFGHVENPSPAGCVATAGATGAIRLCLWNFLEPGQKLITHDYFWSPYKAMTVDTHMELELFTTFTEDGGFNVQGALNKMAECLETQGRALLIINTPCQNPTGLGLNRDEVQALRDGMCNLAQDNPDKQVLILIDGAYWEFGDMKDNKALISAFQNMPENALFAFAFSLSKSMTRYGFRTGALAVTCANQEDVDYVVGTMTASIRSTWSNTPRMGQAIFSTCFRDKALFAQLQKEQSNFAALCNNRGTVFAEEAKAAGLPLTPYRSGFFATIPQEDPKALAARLAARNIFLVPMKMGCRVAFCALPTQKIPGLAGSIAESL